MSEKRQKRHPNLRAGAPSAKKAPDTSTRFPKGKSGNPKGRTPGSTNKATREVKALARSILENVVVQNRMLLDAQRGRLAPPVMTMLFHYAYGKPKESVEVKLLERLEVRITDDIGEDPTSAPVDEGDEAEG